MGMLEGYLMAKIASNVAAQNAVTSNAIGEMGVKSALYAMETSTLPVLFFEEKAALVNKITEENSYIYEICVSVHKEMKIPIQITPGKFSSELSKADNGLNVLKIFFPEPDRKHLCYAALMFYTDSFKYTRYMCIEKAGDDDGEANIIECLPNGKRKEHGPCTPDESDYTAKCVAILNAELEAHQQQAKEKPRRKFWPFG